VAGSQCLHQFLNSLFAVRGGKHQFPKALPLPEEAITGDGRSSVGVPASVLNRLWGRACTIQHWAGCLHQHLITCNAIACRACNA
jgi:hypothetical protein